MTVQYLKNNVLSPTGSVLQIVDTKPSGNIYTYTVHAMHINFMSGISVEGVVEIELVDSVIKVSNNFSLFVTNNTYRKLSDLTVHTAETALENGVLKTGFIGEFDLFVQMFGHNVSNTVNAIYPFIVDAIQRKYSLV